MAKKIADTKKMTHEEWLAQRKSSIGGSEAGTILGVNPYSSLLSLYSNKIGAASEVEDNEAMRLGRDLEQYVAERYCEETGNKVKRDNFMYVHDDYDYISANIDRRIVGQNAGLECKTMSSFNGYALDSGEAPAHYVAQCQHYMAVMGFDYMDLAILVYQKGVYWFHIPRDDEYIEKLIALETMFWKENVEKRIPPDPDGSEASKKAIGELFPESAQRMVLIPDIDELLGRYRMLKSEIKEREDEVRVIQNRITFQLGDADTCNGISYGCTWKTQSRKSIDTDALKADGLYEKYTKTSMQRMFRTKEMK